MTPVSCGRCLEFSRTGVIGRSDGAWREGWFSKKEVVTWSILSLLALVGSHNSSGFGSTK
jgi:hypothetical protein